MTKLILLSKTRRKLISKSEREYTATVAKVKCPICSREYEKIWDKKAKEAKMCNKCNRLNISEQKIGKGYQSFGALSKGLFGRIKKSAKVRNIEFNISKEYIWNLFLDQNKKCALSGLPIDMAPKYMRSSTGKSTFIDTKQITASLDRIDSNLGYTEENVQWVHKVINRMKSIFSDDDFVYFCKEVADNNKNKGNTEPSLVSGGNITHKEGATTNS